MSDSLKQLIEFAEQHKEIDAIYKGTNPDGSGIVYYLIVKGLKFKDKINTKTLDLEMKLFPRSGTGIMCLPCTKTPEDCDFLKKCIYKRE